jgi:hypothetical protein
MAAHKAPSWKQDLSLVQELLLDGLGQSCKVSVEIFGTGALEHALVWWWDAVAREKRTDEMGRFDLLVVFPQETAGNIDRFQVDWDDRFLLTARGFDLFDAGTAGKVRFAKHCHHHFAFRQQSKPFILPIVATCRKESCVSDLM